MVRLHVPRGYGSEVGLREVYLTLLKYLVWEYGVLVMTHNMVITLGDVMFIGKGYTIA